MMATFWEILALYNSGGELISPSRATSTDYDMILALRRGFVWMYLLLQEAVIGKFRDRRTVHSSQLGWLYFQETR